MNSDPSNSAKGLTYLLNSALRESFSQIKRNGFWYDGVEALLIVLNALVKLAEQELAPLEVRSEVGSSSNFPEQLGR